MPFSNKDFEKQIPKGDTLAIARFITLVENRVERVEGVKSKLFKLGGKAKVIGVTGSPGSGKSTIVNGLCKILSEKNKKVAVLAVDPTSPFSGGAVLGDRIRMMNASESENVFIRSIATRGHLGGLSKSTYDLIQIFDAAQFDYIILETVGVGQAEVDIARIADTCIVVLVPGMGDGVQALKAGILEIANIFALNKADLPGIERVHRDIKMMLSLSPPIDSWEPPLIHTVAFKEEGLEGLLESVSEHSKWLKESESGVKNRIELMKEIILKLCGEKLMSEVLAKNGEEINSLAQDCVERKNDPYSAINKIVTRK